MKRILFALGSILACAAVYAQLTITPPAITCPTPAAGATSPCTPGGSISAPSSGGGGTTGTTAWGYFDGKFDWAGDYSWNVSLNYSDTSGAPLSPGGDIKVTLTGQWGGWQPYMCNNAGDPLPACIAQYDYPLTGFTYLVVSLKPSVANQVWSAQFVAAGDKGIPCTYANPAPSGSGVLVNAAAYGPAPVVGVWGTYKIPLSAFCVGPGSANVDVYKFHIQDQTGLASNFWYVDNVGFE